MKEPVVFAQAIEALFLHGLRNRLDSEARSRLRTLGLDLDQPIQVAYPVTLWEGALAVAAEVAFPGSSAPEARFEQGRRMIYAYGSTSLGKSVVNHAISLGARRTLERMTRSSRTSNNFNQTDVQEQPDGTLVLTTTVLEEFRPHLVGREWAFNPDYYRGLFTGVLETFQVKDFSVRTEAWEPREPRIVTRVHLPQ